ncbi:MAG: hypothetical protein AAGF23_04090 [Acidobacteriota bacterium]
MTTTRDAFLSPPDKAGDLAERFRQHKEFAEAAALALEVWIERLNRSRTILAADSRFDPETDEPLNDPARLYLLNEMAVNQFLKWAAACLKSVRDLTSSEPSPELADFRSRIKAGGGQAEFDPELKALARMLALVPSVGRQFLQELCAAQTKPAEYLTDQLDSGTTAFGHWLGDLETMMAAHAGTEPEFLDLKQRVSELCEAHLHPALKAAQATLTLARSSDPSEGESDEGILPIF